MRAIQQSEKRVLDAQKDEILSLIKDELIKRYQYKEGLYQYYLTNNSEIKKAAVLLNNPTEYHKLLKK
jgi:carboxyl-terminal processing protease